MRDAVELFAQVPDRTRAVGDRDAQPEERVGRLRLLPRAEHLPLPRLASLATSGFVHT